MGIFVIICFLQAMVFGQSTLLLLTINAMIEQLKKRSFHEIKKVRASPEEIFERKKKLKLARL